MCKLYPFWNEKINVISRKDIDQLYLHHILHSLSIGCVVKFRANTRVLDAGTGGGFPGIPLAVLFPDVNFTLADSIKKKIRVVDEIAQALELKNVTTKCVRVETISETFDFITGRAITDLLVFYNMLKDKIEIKNRNDIPNGMLYLSGGDQKSKLKEIPVKKTITKLSDFFPEPYFSTKNLIHIQTS